MTWNTTDPTTVARSERQLPDWLAVYTTYGLQALVVGTVLCLLALFTNAVPDPPFP